MKNTIDIIVRAPGCTFSSEFYFIVDCLRNEGYEVEILDVHPPSDVSVTKLQSNNTKITLIAKHLPWGG